MSTLNTNNKIAFYYLQIMQKKAIENISITADNKRKGMIWLLYTFPAPSFCFGLAPQHARGTAKYNPEQPRLSLISVGLLDHASLPRRILASFSFSDKLLFRFQNQTQNATPSDDHLLSTNPNETLSIRERTQLKYWGHSDLSPK